MEKEIVVGGQAVIEGVLMRTKNYSVIAVRKPDKGIELVSEKLEAKKAFDFVFLRGVVMLFESMRMGIKALSSSANIAGQEESMTKKDVFIAFSFAAVFAVALFIILPFFVTSVILKDRGVLFNIVDGLIRLVFFLAYLFFVSQIPDIRRVFQYHGAEHKAVNAYEAGKKLEISEVKKYSTAHLRCGTNFMLIVMIVSILLFSLITGAVWLRIISRIILIPVVAGLSYEVLKLIAKFEKNRFVRIFAYPGLMLQRLTTREPDESQIEVSIAALKKALELEKDYSSPTKVSSK